jgi:hypothetical protein
LSQAARRHGDDLYRLTLLLTLDATAAQRILLAAATQYQRNPSAPPDEVTLANAILAQLPTEPKRPLTRLPPWLESVPLAAQERTFALALLRLPSQQRLVLLLTLLRGYSIEDVAAVLQRDAALVRDERAAALDTLALSVPDAPIELLSVAPAEECRATRTALRYEMVADDPATRAHLALCPKCRAVAAAQQQASRAAEQTLRAMLRPQRLPSQLLNAIDELTQPKPKATMPALHQWRWIALPIIGVALISLLLILWPGRNTAQPQALTADRPPADPRTLVDQARATLFRSPQVGQPWHGRWQIFWPFIDGSSTMLNAELWRDDSTGRYRFSLVHEQGGGPYEFALANGGDRVWYAIDNNYAPSIFPLSESWRGTGVVINLADRQQQQLLLQNRLVAGAWGLADQYLALAQQAPELRGWGRRRAADGTLLDLVGFSAVSPLAPPADGEPQTATILLAFDDQQRLREISELNGPTEGERTGRTVWRFLDDEQMTSGQAALAFDFGRAWTGAGTFVSNDSLYHPALPTLRTNQTTPLVRALSEPWIAFPADAPAGVDTAALLLRGGRGVISNVFYFGEQRTLSYQTIFRRDSRLGILPDNCQLEQIRLDDREIILCPRPAKGFEARVSWDDGLASNTLLRVSARGFERAELLELLRTSGSLTLDGLRKQLVLFPEAASNSSSVSEALLEALTVAKEPPVGQVRRIEWRSFVRQTRADSQLDPYHVALYANLAPLHTSELWVRRTTDQNLDYAFIQRDPTGTIARRTLWSQGTRVKEAVDRQMLWVLEGKNSATPSRVDQLVLQMVQCADAEVVRAAPTTIELREIEWLRNGCLGSLYLPLWDYQTTLQSGAASSLERGRGLPDEGPYLADLGLRRDRTPELISRVQLTNDGQVQKVELVVDIGSPQMVLESHELLSNTTLPEAQLPPDVFDQLISRPILFYDFSDVVTSFGVSFLVRTSTLTNSARLMTSPTYYFPDSNMSVLAAVERAEIQDNAALVSDLNGPIEDALAFGFASRQIYFVRTAYAAQTVRIYQGEAERFGAFLRASAFWDASQPVELTVGGQPVPAWQVEFNDTFNWLLFELNGTLIAAPDTLAVRELLQNNLQVFTP